MNDRTGKAWPLLIPLLAIAASLSSGGCGSQGGATMPAGSGKGYPTRSQPVAASQARPDTAAASPRAVPPAPVTPAPPPAVSAAPPAPFTAPPTQRPYEPPMPLEPSQSRPVSAPPPAPNAANTTAGGLRFSVRGVDPSDVLNVRAGPSPKHEIVGTIPPDANGLIPIGGRRQIGPAVWREVNYRGVRGWVNDRFLVEELPSQQRAR